MIMKLNYQQAIKVLSGKSDALHGFFREQPSCLPLDLAKSSHISIAY